MNGATIDTIHQVFARGTRITCEAAHDRANGSCEGRVAAAQESILHINVMRGGSPDDIAAIGQRLTLHRVTPTSRYSAQAIRIENAVPGGMTVKVLTVPNKTERREYLRVRCQLPFQWRQVAPEELIGRRNVGQQAQDARQQVERMVQDVSHVQTASVLMAILERLNRLEEKVERIVERMQESGFMVEDVITEISGGGMRFLTQRRIRVGDMIEAIIQPDEHDEEVRIQARVLRIHPPNLGRAQPSVACRFITINSRDREAIIRYTFRRPRELLRRAVV
ncbi:MAG: PilZ domain-containing protein [Myxococcota bacterium]